MRNVLLLVALAAVVGCSGTDANAPDPRVADASRPIVLLTHPNNPPFSYRNDAGELVGDHVDLARKIAARLGRALTVEGVDYETIIPRLKAGTADFGIASITITPARLRDVDFSVPYEIGGCGFMYRAGEPKPRMSQLSTLRVAAETGTLGDIYLCRHGCDPVRFSRMEDAERMLANNEVDAVFCDESSIKASAEASAGKFLVTEIELREGYGIAVDKRRPDVLAAANAVIAEGGAK